MAETLLDIFTPPDGMVGHSAALVAMTGTEDFLEAAVHRFTMLAPKQRSQLGNVFVYLMLDGHATLQRDAVFRPGCIPSLHELQPRVSEPESLLHAKLALLAFAPSRTATPQHIRLAVCTANWTDRSARHQLELVWAIDVPLDGPRGSKDRADVRAAAVFVEQLLEKRFYRDEQERPKRQRKLTRRLDALLDAAKAAADDDSKPRFIHSLEEPLLKQIGQRLKGAIKAKRNFLLCGSGFYEAPSGKASKPSVFVDLEKIDVVTTNVRRVALVEPDDAGAVAAWAKGGATDGWEIYRPSDALHGRRRLHAKFVYAGYLRDRHLSNGWLYVGSGNLSHRGLVTTGLMKKGNIECGVVFEAADRLGNEEIERRLFWNPDAEGIDPSEWKVGEPGDAPESPRLLKVPPILSAYISGDAKRTLNLLWRDDAKNGAAVSVRWAGHDWQRVILGGSPIPLEDADKPAAIDVRDETIDQEWSVPVVDAAGQICWTPPRFASFADALAAILDFPSGPGGDTGEEEDGDEGGEGDQPPPGTGQGRSTGGEKSYALYAAAELIEKVASIQGALSGALLDEWLEHLDRVFRGSFPQELIKAWRDHGINVLTHLREPLLRPSQLSERQQRRYLEVLCNAAQSWGFQ